MKRNFKLIISYDGTRFSGWERKDGRDTVQGKMEDVLEKMAGEPVKLIAAGRTDAGVHAAGMCANVHIDTRMTEKEIRDYLNRYLPGSIAVTEVRECSERFHARYNAVGKTYQYTCFAGEVRPVFDRRYVTVLDFSPDVEKMRSAAQVLVGEHDFMAFCGNTHFKKSAIRNVDTIDISEEGGYIRFTLHGNGFLQNMVRIIVGTLLEVGRGKLTADDVSEILASRVRKNAGPTAPPQGLCLMSVDY